MFRTHRGLPTVSSVPWGSQPPPLRKPATAAWHRLATLVQLRGAQIHAAPTWLAAMLPRGRESPSRSLLCVEERLFSQLCPLPPTLLSASVETPPPFDLRPCMVTGTRVLQPPSSWPTSLLAASSPKIASAQHTTVNRPKVLVTQAASLVHLLCALGLRLRALRLRCLPRISCRTPGSSLAFLLPHLVLAFPYHPHSMALRVTSIPTKRARQPLVCPCLSPTSKLLHA